MYIWTGSHVFFFCGVYHASVLAWSRFSEFRLSGI